MLFSRTLNIAALLAVFPSLLYAWDEKIHVSLAEKAVSKIPQGISYCFVVNRSSISSSASALCSAAGDSLRLHWFNFEDVASYPYESVPEDYEKACFMCGYINLEDESSVGALPWLVKKEYRNLVNAFKNNDDDGVVAASGLLSHYINDANMPLHATANCDGQIIGCPGVNSRIETLSSAHSGELLSSVNTVQLPISFNQPDVFAYVMAVLENSNSRAYPLMIADAQVMKTMGVAVLSKEDEDKYSSMMLRKIGPLLKECLNDSALDTARLWYWAWIEAGKPLIDVKVPSGLMAGKFVPPDGKTLLVVGQNKESMEAYVESTKIIPAGFMAYTAIQHAKGLGEPYFGGAGIMHAQDTAERYKNSFLQIGLYLVGALDDIVNGVYDQNIDSMSKWIISVNRPVYLRIGYEFDLPENRYDPKKYIAAYRYIVDRCRENNVSNAAFVWHSFGGYSRIEPMEYYPGDEYVDWFGVSFFNNGTYARIKTMLRLSRAHLKPFMIAESTPAKIGVHKGKDAYYRWYRPLFDFIEKYDVKMLCYINTNWDDLPMFVKQEWGDSRVQSNDYVKNCWISEIRKDRYINSSMGIFGSLGWGLPVEHSAVHSPPAEDQMNKKLRL